MPSAWMIGPFVVKSGLVLLFISFILGFLFFQMMSPFSKSKTKNRNQEISSILFTFLVSLWVGKILLHLDIFISDPRAIIAYPSDSSTFYTAVLLTVLYSGNQMARYQQPVVDVLLAWMYVFLPASFVFEVTNLILGNGLTTLAYPALLFILLISMIVWQEKITKRTLAIIVWLGWSSGQLMISLLTPYTAIFQFRVDSWFWMIIVGGLLFFIILFDRKVKAWMR